MISTIFLARRDLSAHRGRTLLTLMGITLGVAVVLAIQVTNQTTLDSLRGVFDRTTGRAALLIVPVNASKQPLDQDILEKASSIAGVAAAAPSIQASTLLASDAASWQIAFSMNGIAAGNYFLLFGVDPELDPAVRVYILETGRLPKPGKYELVIPAEFAREKKILVGDRLEILVEDGTATLEVVGLLSSEGVAMLNDGSVGFAPLEVVQDLFGREGELDEISLGLAPAVSDDPNQLEGFKDRLSERLGDQARVVYPAARGQLVSQMLATYQLGLTFFSVIAIFVGAFLIYNAFSMTVVERTREIGMLRAVGMSRVHVLRMILAEAGLLSLVGSTSGLLVGFGLARGLIRLLGQIAAPTGNDRLSVPPQVILQSIAVGIGVTLVAALIPGLQAARISPLEALSVRSYTTGKARPILWIIGLILLAGGWLMTYRIPWPPA